MPFIYLFLTQRRLLEPFSARKHGEFFHQRWYQTQVWRQSHHCAVVCLVGLALRWPGDFGLLLASPMEPEQSRPGTRTSKHWALPSLGSSCILGACQLREDLAIFAAQQGFHKGYDWKANCPCWRTLLWQHCTPAGGHARSIAGNSALTQAVANLQV